MLDILSYVGRSANRLFFARVFRLLPLKRNKILFSSHNRRYSCNPKYIAEEIIRQKLPVKMVWIVDGWHDDHFADFPPGMRLIRNNSVRFFYEVATAGIWVDNTLRNEIFGKKAAQFFIQTWHGSFGIKRFADSGVWPERIRTLANVITDCCISNSTFETREVYKESFWPTAPVREFGHPRNDILIKPPDRIRELREGLAKRYGFCPKDRIILHAPTFRKSRFPEQNTEFDNSGFFKTDVAHLKTVLTERFGGHWVYLLRLHHRTRPALEESNKSREFFDVTDYPDIQELMTIADAMISDYSSCLFDYLLTGRPAFIFAPDLEEYKKRDRGFYYPLESTPFPIAIDDTELASAILSFDDQSYAVKVAGFLAEKGCCDDGLASKRVVELIKEKIAPLSP